MVVLGLDRPMSAHRLALSRVWTPAAAEQPTVARRDTVNLTLALVNWVVLLLLLCGLLLAKTLPTASGSDVVGSVASVTCHAKTCGKIQPVG